MDQDEIEKIITSVIYGWLRVNVDLDYSSTANAMSEINNKTRFSDLSKKYKTLDKTGFLARVFIVMQQEHLKIPDRFKKFYADEIAKSGFIAGTVSGEGIPNYTPATVGAAEIEKAVERHFKYSLPYDLKFTSDVDTELKNADTVGELAAALQKE
ncbi:Uncharacterized protein ALO51_01907 [Pseudomonas amygdali]|uniref:hypothetical protein n=1 Tax=Pseudomonas amygdali TaxID=47877 RepID=UPI0006E68D7B|nr:hypothetical protein [Pseudomonas amygdali]KPW42783.1 Uncharacterized protein ALO51_01907 [Pseudomonas amygdali]